MFRKIINMFKGFMLGISLFLKYSIDNMNKKRDEQREVLNRIKKRKK